MRWAQITILVLMFVGLLLHARDHGKPKTGKCSFWIGLVAALVNFTLIFLAGAFDKVFR